MPIDASIPLQQTGPVQQPIRTITETLRDQSDLALQQQTQQANALKLQEAQRDAADQQTVRQSIAQYGDLEKALPSLAGRVQPRTFQGLQSYITDHRSKVSEIAKRDSDVKTAQQKIDQDEADTIGSLMLGVRHAGYSSAMLDAALSDMEQHDRYRDEATGIRQAIAQQPEAARQIVDHLISQSPSTMDKVRQFDADAATQADRAADNQRQDAMNAAALAHQKRLEELQGTAKTPAELAMLASDPAKTPEQRATANAALKRLNEYQAAGKPAMSPNGMAVAGDDADAVAKGIQDGSIPPNYINPRTQAGMRVLGNLQRAGYDLTTATRDWTSVQKHLSTLNSTQQERLRQAITFTYDSLDIIEDLFGQWKKAAKPSGFPLLNKANLSVAKALPGQAGAIATSLDAQINDLTSELGTVYKGGNSSTDESLRLASENLKSNWNDAQFSKQLGNIRKNLQIRKNSIFSSQPAGVSPDSPYLPPRPAAESPASSAPVVVWEKGPDGKPRKVTNAPAR